MSDHPKTVNEDVFEVFCAVKMGDTIVTASQRVNVTRTAESDVERMTTERGNIVVDVNQNQAVDTLYNAG